jgi:hypothetical protein
MSRGQGGGCHGGHVALMGGHGPDRRQQGQDVAPRLAQTCRKAAMANKEGAVEHAAAIPHPEQGAPLRVTAEKGAALILPWNRPASPGGHRTCRPTSGKRPQVRPQFDAAALRLHDAAFVGDMLVADVVPDLGWTVGVGRRSETGRGKGRGGPALKQLAVLFLVLPGAAMAHAAEQSFVLLLPTEIYITGGVAVVGLTVPILALLPPDQTERLFRPVTLWRGGRPRTGTVTSCMAALALLGLIWLGFSGSRDPTRNPLPFAIWTAVWMTGLTVQGLTGALWRWIDPFSGPVRALRGWGLRPPGRLPSALGHWPALVSLMALAALLLVHPGASDPDLLAAVTLAYLAVHWTLAVWMGPRWLQRAEALTVAMRAMARIAPLARGRIGLPGWKRQGKADPGLALFMIALLAIGSFDGLYGTFWWLGLIGQNPLEFAGRTAVVVPNGLGLLFILPLLTAILGATLMLGRRIAGGGPALVPLICAFAPALLPIALGYHIAHFLPALLVDWQAVPNLLTDPLGSNADWLGIGYAHVTTGFFNRLDTVRLIWLTQGAAVVLGHVAAIVMTHRIAQRIWPGRALAAHGPLALFMVGYTLFGLWLLAAPQGA